MKKKKFAFLSLVLAVLMALSLVLVACGGREEDKKPGGNEPGGNEPGGNEPGGDTGDEADVIRGDVVEGSGAVATISDTSLEGKFWAMYPLEDSLAVEGNENYVVAAAINPYTGAAQASLTDDDEMEMYYGENTQLVANPTTTGRGNSKYVFDTDSTHISLPAIPDSYFSEIDNYEVDLEAAEKTGLSVSFWAYNNESPVGTVATGQASDWSNVMTNGFAAVTWGNITNIGAGNIAVYPANHAYLGRGAYTATSYPLAQQALSTEQLSARPASVPTNTYYVYNAINGGRLEADNESVAPYVVEMLNDMAKTWRYVTINIDYEEGVSFYNNGLLVYRYAPDAIDSTAGSTAYDWDRLYSEFIYGVSEGNREYNYLNMFNAESGIYVDDILVGASLTMDEVETLYEDLAGLEAGTVDNTLASTAAGDKLTAEAEAAADLLKKRWAAYDTAVTEEVGTGSAVETIGTKDRNVAYADGFSKNTFKPADGSAYEVKIVAFGASGGGENWYAPNISVYSGDGNYLGVVRVDSWVNDNVNGNPGFAAPVQDMCDQSFTWASSISTIAANGEWTKFTDTNNTYWAEFQNIIEWARFDITITYDGTDLTFAWKITPIAHGQTITGTSTTLYKNEEGELVNATASETASSYGIETAATLKAGYTITASNGVEYNADKFLAVADTMYFGISTEKAYVTIASVTGATVQAPAAA